MTFGSLFAGIGGLDLGLERAGMVCKWQVEIDDYATKVLERHWPDVTRFRDVRDCGQHNLERVDLICGGFPCQDISLAGKGEGIEGARSGLWSDFYRIICELRPRYALVENVPALLNRGMGRVLGDLAKSGYDAEWQCLPAVAFGAPHRRDRVFILAYTNKFRKVSINTNARNGRTLETQKGKSFRICSSHNMADAGSTNATYWAIEPNVDRVADGVPHRVDRLRGLGNAVVPQVAEWIGQQIISGDMAG